MFQGGAIRVVEVPDSELTGRIEDDLEKIFRYGQNDFQPLPDRVSVSAGDVVRYHGTRYLVDTIGFKKLNNGGALSRDPLKRISQLIFGKEKNDRSNDRTVQGRKTRKRPDRGH
jgi:hypothetical protein